MRRSAGTIFQQFEHVIRTIIATSQRNLRSGFQIPMTANESEEVRRHRHNRIGTKTISAVLKDAGVRLDGELGKPSGVSLSCSGGTSGQGVEAGVGGGGR